MGQNFANSTIKVHIDDGVTLDISQDKIMLYLASINFFFEGSTISKSKSNNLL
jgi:hypothetical protein